MSNSRLAYSTENGSVCPDCGKPADECVCGNGVVGTKKDGVVRIRREVKGRAGKTVTTISGIPLARMQLEAVASELKRRCHAGGSVKAGVIVIQGDHRKTAMSILEAKGYKVKLAGG
jgi:translation initiation factor 1